MAIPYSLEDLEGIKSDVLLPLNCEFCGKEFYAQKKFLKSAIKRNIPRYKLCGKNCQFAAQITLHIAKCAQCGQEAQRHLNQFKKSKSGNIFCNSSCAATYNNLHKTTGTRISKLERWLEQRLLQNYPKLEIHFNRKDAVGSELDIYIPSLKLAFELNGIYHYEPIHGQEKLDQIQANDLKKSLACTEKSISIHVIDTSKQLRFTESSSGNFLKRICSIIDQIKSA